MLLRQTSLHEHVSIRQESRSIVPQVPQALLRILSMGRHSSPWKNPSSLGKSQTRRVSSSTPSVPTPAPGRVAKSRRTMPGTQKEIPRYLGRERTRTSLPRRKEKKRGNGQRRYGKASLRIRSSPGSLRRQLGSSGMHTQRKTVQRRTVHWTNETSRVTNQNVGMKARFLDGLKKPRFIFRTVQCQRWK